MKVQGVDPRGQFGVCQLRSVVGNVLFVAAACVPMGCGGGNGSDLDASVDLSTDAAESDNSTPHDGDLPDADPNALRFTFWYSTEVWHVGAVPLNIEAEAEGGSPPYAYAWTPADRFPNDGFNDFEVFRREEFPGEYETCVTVTDSAGDAVSDCLVREAFPIPVASIGDLPEEFCVQDSPITITVADNLVEGTAPNRRVLGRRRVDGDRLPNVIDPVSPFQWAVDATAIGDWEVSYYIEDSADYPDSVSEYISIIDCP